MKFQGSYYSAENNDLREQVARRHGLLVYLAGDEWAWEADCGADHGFETQGEAVAAFFEAVEE